MAASSHAPKLTVEQSAAITRRTCSISLNAGAGSGKTFVLTQRFLAHLDPVGPEAPAGLDQLVAITFTERAAGEMRARIARACRRRLLTCPEDEANHWLAILRGLPNARISTIHGFCGALLRAFPVEAGLDPSFQVLDEIQSSAMATASRIDTLAGLLAEQHEPTLDLAATFGLWRLKSILDRFLDDAAARDWDHWREVGPEDLVERWHEHFREVIKPLLMGEFLASDPLAELAELLKTERPTHPKMLERWTRLPDLLAEIPGHPQPTEILTELGEVAKVQGGGTKKNWASEDLYARVRDCLAAVRTTASRLKGHLSFDPVLAREAARLGCLLLQTAEPLHRAYELRKRELNCLDFDDLVVRAERLLESNPDGLRTKLAEGLRLVLIDEFQDTDPLQASLVRYLIDLRLEDGKLFFVGDPQQSIYRFRGADPTVFAHLRQSLDEPGRLALTRNFRSQPAILNFVNALFAEGQPYQPLSAARPQVTPEPAIEFLWATGETDDAIDNNGDNDDTSVGALRNREARWLARRLRQMFDSNEPLVATTDADGQPSVRPPQPGDVAILFRALSDLPLYEAALRDAGVPYYVVGGHAFYAQQEVFDLFNLLRAVSQPHDEVALLGALRSPLFALSDETIFWLGQRGRSLREAVRLDELPPEIPPAQQAAVARARGVLDELAAEKDRRPIAELLRHALELTAYDAGLLGEFLGERKLANLEKLVDLARSFDSSGVFTLDDYVAQLGEYVARQPKEPPAPTEPETADVVRLMTIHQAKGLEFPIVCVPDLARQPAAAGIAAHFDPELGPLVKPPSNSDTPEAANGLSLYNVQQGRLDATERLRILYVAATRASDYLILSAGFKDIDRPGASPWMKLLASRFDLASGEPLAACTPEPRVRVTTDEPPAPPRGEAFRGRPDLAEVLDAATETAEAYLPPWVGTLAPDRQAPRVLRLSQRDGTLELATPEFAAVGEEEILPLDLGPDDEAQLANERLLRALIEQIDWARPGPLSKQAERLALQLHLPGRTPAQTQRVVGWVTDFLATPHAAALGQAQEVWRNLPFLLPWPGPSGEPIALEGETDLVYRSPSGDVHVLLLRSHHPTGKSAGDADEATELTLWLHCQAIGRFFGTAPASAIVYDGDSGRSLRLPPETDAQAMNGRLARLVATAVGV